MDYWSFYISLRVNNPNFRPKVIYEAAREEILHE